MAKKMHETPMLDQLERGPGPASSRGSSAWRRTTTWRSTCSASSSPRTATSSATGRAARSASSATAAGVIPRFTELKGEDGKPLFPEAAEFHTLRVQPPAGMHYDTELLRKLCDIWEKHGSGLIAFHGQSRRHHVPGLQHRERAAGLRRFQRDRLRPGRRRPGAAHLDVLRRLGALRDESCYDEAARAAQRHQHQPRRHAPPVAAVQVQVQVLRLPERLRERDPALGHGDHRHLARQHPQRREAGAGVVCQARHGRTDRTTWSTRCPTKAIRIRKANGEAPPAHVSRVKLDDAQCLEIDNHDCVRCMHCLNVMPGALRPGQDSAA